MDIGILIQWFSPAPMIGPIRHIKALSTKLAIRGHDVTVLTTDIGTPEGTPEREKTTEGVKVIRLPGLELGQWRWSPGLQKELENHEFDILHSQSYRNYFTMKGSEFTKENNIPFILTPRGSILGFQHMATNLIQEVPNRLYDFVMRHRSLEEAHVIVTSKQEKEDARSVGVPKDHLHMIPHGMDFSELPAPPEEESLSANRGTMKLLFVGRLSTQRNIPLLLRSFARARQQNANLELSIVGDPIKGRLTLAEQTIGWRLKRLQEKLGLEDCVTFHGGLYGDDLWEAYREHDLFVYPSRWDNFGHALIEAAHFRLPIISTPTGVAPILLDGDKGGKIVPQNDPDSFSQAIIDVTSSPSKFKEVHEIFPERLDRFRLEQNVSDHESLYKSLEGTD